jgi:tetratricopeptide (TPR) repeat protein
VRCERRRQLLLIISAILFITGCRKKVVVSPPPPPSPELFFTQGLSDFHKGTPEAYTRAADEFRSASKLKPENCEFALNLAQSLLFLSAEQVLNWEAFEPTKNDAAAVVDTMGPTCLSSHEPFVLRLRALVAGRGPAATQMIDRAIDLDPNDAMNWVVLGYLDPGNPLLVTPEGAGRWVAMTHAFGLNHESALIQYELGKNYQTVPHKEAESRQAFNRAIEMSSRHFRSYLGLAYSADEDTDVEPLYRKVVEIAPNFLEGRLALGSYYGSLDEIEKASEQYFAALAINPKYDVAEFRLGVLMMGIERNEEAEKHFTRVIELNPASYEAFYHLGNLLYRRNNFDEAKQRYEQALNIRSNYAEAEYGIGWVYRQKDRNDEAIAQFDKVTRLQPDYGDAHLARGDIRAERHQFIEAIADYNKAIAAYEQQLKYLNASIAAAEAKSGARVAQAEKKRTERDKARVEVVLEHARKAKAEVENVLK